eukprot:scaffold424_cov165-Ochromonas_danica.AAC.28
MDGTIKFAGTITAIAVIGIGSYLLIYEGWLPWTKDPEIESPPTLSSFYLDQFKKRKSDGPYVEICVSDYHSAKQAFHGGAHSLELCSNRSEGGTTPSFGLIEQCAFLVRGTEVELHVLIRPRPGDFIYSDEEFDLIQRDVIAAKVAGADGIVCGMLTTQGKVDIERMRVIHWQAAIDDILLINCDRLLTSGQETSALLAAQNGKLGDIVKKCKGLLEVVAAAGISEETVSEVIRGSNVTAIHAGAAVTQLTSVQPTTMLEAMVVSAGTACVAPEMISYMCTQAVRVEALVLAAEKTWRELSVDCEDDNQ